MPVLALLVTLVASLALAPVDANCAGDCEARYGTGRRPLTLATGSPGELGLLSALADVFAPREDATLCWIKAGSGEALKLLRKRILREFGRDRYGEGLYNDAEYARKFLR